MKSQHPNFQAPSAQIEDRVNQLISTLTLEEKIDMLGGNTKGTPGLAEKNIPAIRFADGPVGVHWWCDASTAYPALIALASSFDSDLAYRYGQALGNDCRARGVHILLAPGVNIYRSPLCGRNFEYTGEDPHLASQVASAYICGVQDKGVSATVKHFAVNYQEYDRHGVSSDVDERTLREIYLPAFRAAVDAGVGCVMNAYNLLNGEHCSESDWLINDLLKTQWNFDGVLMSDWDSTYSTVKSANAGLDLEMPTAKNLNTEKLLPAVRNGLVSEAVIDEKVRRQLRLAACFGWLDHEQKDDSIPLDDPASVAVALDVAREGTVLLKNTDNLLPLDAEAIKSIAVVGFHASDTPICGGGSAFTPPFHKTNILDGLKTLVGDKVQLTHHQGVHPYRYNEVFAESKFFTLDGEAGLEGEYFSNRNLEGAPAFGRVDEHINFSWWNDKKVGDVVDCRDFSARWKGILKPTKSGTHAIYLRYHSANGRVWLDGKLLIDSEKDGKIGHGGTLTAYCELDAGNDYKIESNFRVIKDWNGAFLGWQHEDDINIDTDDAIAAASQADVAIVCTGFTEQSEGEGWDRTFALAPQQEKLIRDIAAVNENTIVVVQAGGGVDMASWLGDVKGLVYLWYPGQEGGTALAEILFGLVNPSARLPITIERKLEDRSSTTCYHDEDGDKRVELADGVFGGYRHFDRENIAPLFPFGFGLGYTTFAYSDLQLSADKTGVDETLVVSFAVANTGDRVGTETAQVYIGDVESSHPRPIKELKGFCKIELSPGESKRVEINITTDELAYFDPDVKAWIVENGKFTIQIGSSATDIKLESEFEFNGDC